MKSFSAQKVCRYLAVAVGRAIARVGHLTTQNQWLALKVRVQIWSSSLASVRLLGQHWQGCPHILPSLKIKELDPCDYCTRRRKNICKTFVNIGRAGMNLFKARSAKLGRLAAQVSLDSIFSIIYIS